MTGEIIPFKEVSTLPANLVDKFGDSAESLISGSGGFPVLSIRGSKWRIKIEGDETPLTNADTGEAVPSLELVIIRAVEGLSKNFYAKKYVEGDDAAPDCYSIGGEFPDAGAASKQSESCAACPHNVWGSKITDEGKKSKQCGDSKILAVTFPSDLENEALGGPMMLRVPAASLKDLTRFGKAMKNQGYIPQQISMRVGFDMNASYPKLTFKAVRPMAQDEVNIIGELYDSDQVVSIITDGGTTSTPAAAPKQDAVDTSFEQAPVDAPAPSVSVAAKPKAEAKRKPAAKKAEKVEVVPEPETGDIDSDLDSILGEL